MLSIFLVKRTGSAAQSCSLLRFWGVCKWWTFSDPKGQRQCKEVLDHWAENCNPDLAETGPGWCPLMCFIINRKQSWLLPRTPRGAFLRNPGSARRGGKRRAGGQPCPAGGLPLPEHVFSPAPLPASCSRRDLAGMLEAGRIPERLYLGEGAAGSEVPLLGGCPRNGLRGPAPGPAAPGRGDAGAAWPLLWGGGGTRLLVFKADVIFFNATSLLQLVADSRIRFPMLFAFPVLWRIKIFVFLQSVPRRSN